MQRAIIENSCSSSVGSKKPNESIARCQYLHAFLVTRVRDFDHEQTKKGLRE